METANLLNITSKAAKANNSLPGTGASVDLFADRKENVFKSTFKAELKKQDNHDSRSVAKKDKDLPQSGNDLPDKKKRVTQDEQEHDSDKNTRVQSQTSHDHQKSVSEEHQQTHDRNESGDTAAKESESDTEQGFQSISESVKTVLSTNVEDTLNNTMQAQPVHNAAVDVSDLDSSESGSSELSDLISGQDTYVSDTSVSSESVIPTQVTESEPLSTAVIAPITPSMSDVGGADKRISVDQVVAPVSDMRKMSSELSSSEFSSKSSDEKNGSALGKNGSALGKSVADFQQYIELSKKQSSSEPIASVKNFDEALKAQQANVQLVTNESKQPAAQMLSATQMPLTSIPLDRVIANAAGTSSPSAQTFASLEVKTPVGKTGWSQGFTNQIIMMAKNGLQQAKIKLNPMHLGPVEAMIKITGETAVVNLSSLHLTTKEAMDNAIPRLKEMLNENGFSQVDVNVSHQDKKEQQEASFNLNKERSNSEHGNSTMPGEEQLSEVNHDSESDAKAGGSLEQDLNIVDYYA